MASSDERFREALAELCTRSGLALQWFSGMDQYRFHPTKVETYTDPEALWPRPGAYVRSAFGEMHMCQITFALEYDAPKFRPESQRRDADFESTGEWIDEQEKITTGQRRLAAES